MTRRERAIRIAEQGRASHVSWMEYLAQHPNVTMRQLLLSDHNGPATKVATLMGSIAHQKEWIRNYDLFLAELRKPA